MSRARVAVAVVLALLVALAPWPAHAARSQTASTNEFWAECTNPVSDFPLTVAGWAKFNTPSTFQHVLGMTTSGSSSAYADLYRTHIDLGAPFGVGTLIASCEQSASFGNAVTPSAVSIDEWHHVAWVRSGGNSNAIYVDGTANKGTDTTSIVWSPWPDTLTVGGWHGAFTVSCNGTGACWTAWSVALTDAEIDALAAHAHPASVRPGARAFYDPMDEAAGMDLVGQRTVTTAGTSKVERPPGLVRGRPR